jgi:uncharacterized membrane protein (UPF0127 family)
MVMLLLGAIGCTNQAPVAQTETQPPAPATGPRVTLADGTVFKVEIAAEEQTRAEGLMFRDHLNPYTGMLFFFPAEGEYPFWMKNTKIPLDMIWIDANRRVVAVKINVPPCVVDDCPSYPPNAKAKYVLELAGGEAQKHGMKVGDVLRIDGTDNVVPQ